MPGALREFVRLARQRRVDMVVHGDSNAFQLSYYGQSWGIRRALRRRMGINFYASALLPLYADGSWGSGDQQEVVAGGVSGFSATGAPTELAQYALPGVSMGGMQNPYIYLASGTTTSGTNSSLYHLTSSDYNALTGGTNDDVFPGADQNYKWEFTYGTFPSGGPGAFRPRARVESTLSFKGDTPDTINPVTGSYGLVDYSHNIPAGSFTGSSSGWHELHVATVAGVTAPFFGLCQRVYFPSVTAGCGVSTLFAYGGRGTRSLALFLQDAASTNTSWGEYFRELCRHQDANPANWYCCHYIALGRNDRSSGNVDNTSPAVGTYPGATHQASGTVEGFKENLREVINKLRGFWQAAGGNVRNLTFAIDPGHPQTTLSTPVATFAAAAREIIPEYSDTLIDVVDQSCMWGATEAAGKDYFETNNYYQPSDQAHLSKLGYLDMYERIMSAYGSRISRAHLLYLYD